MAVRLILHIWMSKSRPPRLLRVLTTAWRPQEGMEIHMFELVLYTKGAYLEPQCHVVIRTIFIELSVFSVSLHAVYCVYICYNHFVVR